MTRTVTRLFDDYDQARRAVEALEGAGFSSLEISLLSRYNESGELTDDSSAAVTGATIGGMAGAGAGILTALGVIAIPGVGPLVAAGVLATTLAGAARRRCGRGPGRRAHRLWRKQRGRQHLFRGGETGQHTRQRADRRKSRCAGRGNSQPARTRERRDTPGRVRG